MTKLPAGRRMKCPHQEHVLRFGPWTKVVVGYGERVQNAESAFPCPHGGEVLKLKERPDAALHTVALTDRQSGKPELRDFIYK
ncbi:hypothetical protein MGG_17515 [Pyricularia oryzae 70-15]|uniref:Uncharacterized protein n=1 Tax=Pyricularia oryzae (strain 70-15 / ATCC MYA-4617 / FGSC 8958) TaxID=242507 RepID=G4NDW8_PYRO7|nr:uncharacterized protein MGG_17515 [Pyricularia oryzae 70-15]EHA49350.1 hypothetical protein MGG_17515 [Pyricularia oryzae 70-15]